jgi:hypothetical protein
MVQFRGVPGFPWRAQQRESFSLLPKDLRRVMVARANAYSGKNGSFVNRRLIQ